MNEEIVQLTLLQVIDHELDSIDSEIQGEQEALEKRSADLSARGEAVAKLEGKIENLEKERRTLDMEAADEMAHVKDRQSKMMQVQTGREQAALLKEIEDGKKGVKEKEEKIVAIMEEAESLTTEVEELKNLLKGETELLQNETEKVKKNIEKILKGKKSKEKKREAQAKNLRAPLLKKYDTLRQHRDGLAVVNVLQGVCQGCFMAIPPQRYNVLLRGDEYFDCPTCQRIMYHQPVEETEKEGVIGG